MSVGVIAEQQSFIHDLHSHTTASDGCFSPRQLIERAVSMRVGVLAITDHDTVTGLAEAEQSIIQQQLPLTLIAGVEISTLWRNLEIHIVGLRIEKTAPALVKLLLQQAAKRYERAGEIGRRLDKCQIPGALAGAERLANNGMITRGHFAQYIVELGLASSVGQVFKKYLAKGKSGYVPPFWCSMDEAVKAIQQAGGKAVLAHPGRYSLSAKWLRCLLEDFKSSGGDAIEVAQCQQPQNERIQLAQYARQYDLLASQGSDFHRPCSWIELGRNLWLPKGCDPVWSHW